MISTKGRYALRVMIDIAIYSNGEYVSLKEISSRQEISLKYLEQVVSLLMRASLLQSLRGNNGGYKLSRNPKDFTVWDILNATEGSLAPVECLGKCTNDCPRNEKCSTIEFWKGLDDVVTTYLKSVTLEKLVNDYKSKSENDYSI